MQFAALAGVSWETGQARGPGDGKVYAMTDFSDCRKHGRGDCPRPPKPTTLSTVGRQRNARATQFYFRYASYLLLNSGHRVMRNALA